MDIVVQLTLKILIIVVIGFIAAKIKIIDDVSKEKLSSLLVNLLLPVSMLASSQQPFAVHNLKGAAYIAIISSVYYLIAFISGHIIGKMAGMDKQKVAMFTLLISFANTGFIGMPILKQIVGETGTLYGAIYNSVFDILYFSYGIYLLTSTNVISNNGGQRLNKIENIRQIFKNQMIWIAVLTVIMYVIPFRLPNVVTESMNLIGNCMMPVSMLIVGAEIAGVNIKKVLTHKASYGVSLLRMAVFPLITYIIMKLINADFEVMAAVVILAAMPSGSLNVIMGQKYKNNAEFAAIAVMQNTVVMMFTLPFFIYLSLR